MTAVSIWLANILGIKYGSAAYRFPLVGEIPLRWLTYGATMARQAPGTENQPLTTTHF